MASSDQYNPKSKPRKADNLEGIHAYQPDNPRSMTPQEREQHIRDNEAMYHEEMERRENEED